MVFYAALSLLLLVCQESSAFLEENQPCPTRSELTTEMEKLDSKYAFQDDEFEFDYQARLKNVIDPNDAVDQSSQKLFSRVDETKLSTGTYGLFLKLRDNYNPTKNKAEDNTPQELSEQDAFLSAVIQTGVMGLLYKYSLCKGWVTDEKEFRSKLEQTWFEDYQRKGGRTVVKDTNGFEHVFLGEYKDDKLVNGYHNWISFYLDEKAGKIDYYGYASSRGDQLVGAAFMWNNHYKSKGSFLLGVTPEFDMAVYSLCFWEKPGEKCTIELSGRTFTIQSYEKDGHLSTAYMY